MKWRRATGLILVCAGFACPARAETPDEEANRHFNHALELVSAGALDLAIDELEAAYRVSPRYEVLHNLGQAYGLVGRPVEAADALRRYLDQGGNAIKARRRAQVEASISLYERMIGTLAVVVTPPAASLTVDGKSIESGSSLRLPSGRHTVAASLDGYTPAIKTVDVPSGSMTSASLELEPIAAAAPGFFEVRCPVPEVSVAIDGTQLAKTPVLESVPLKAGQHRVRFDRPDYAPREKQVVVRSGEVIKLDCGVKPQANLAAARSALLRLEVSEPDASVSVDGERYGGEPLPLGRHFVRVEHAGFEPWSGTWVADPAVTAPLVVSLRATPEFRRAYRERVRTRQTLGVAAGGVGVALGVVAGGLALASGHEASSWRRDRLVLMRELAAEGATSERLSRVGDLNQRAADIQRLDDMTVAFAIGGAALLVVSLDLLLFGLDAERYERRSKRTSVPRDAAWSF